MQDEETGQVTQPPAVDEPAQALPADQSGDPTGEDPGSGDTSPGDGPEAIESLRQENENLRRRLEQGTDSLLRVQAEMDNLRKRTVRDIENAHKYALDRFIRELLPVIDSMELGISASTGDVTDVDSLREGMDLTMKKFLDTLAGFGVAVIDPVQEKFDPELHQAVTVQEAAGTEPGCVTAVMQKGYQLNGRLVRPAMVIVAK